MVIPPPPPVTSPNPAMVTVQNQPMCNVPLCTLESAPHTPPGHRHTLFTSPTSTHVVPTGAPPSGGGRLPDPPTPMFLNYFRRFWRAPVLSYDSCPSNPNGSTKPAPITTVDHAAPFSQISPGCRTSTLGVPQLIRGHYVASWLSSGDNHDGPSLPSLHGKGVRPRFRKSTKTI